MGKLPIRFLVLALLVFLLAMWLWPSSEQKGAPQARPDQIGVTDAAQSSVSGALKANSSGALPANDSLYSAPPVSFTELDNQELKSRFNAANFEWANDNKQKAMADLKSLIEDFPHIVEPYINLANYYVEQGQLELARQTLSKATKANASTKLLFASLAKVNGALAAESYQKALGIQPADITTPALPLVTKLRADFEHIQEVETLSAQVSELEQELLVSVARAEQIEFLQTQLADAKQTSLRELQLQAERHASAELALQKKLDDVQSAGIAASQAETDLLDGLRVQLDEARKSLVASESKVTDLLAENAALDERLAAARNASAAALLAKNDAAKPVSEPSSGASTASSQTPTIQAASAPADARSSGMTDGQKGEAIELVERWAEAWSAQDVQAYVGFYTQDYTSKAGLSHQQWLKQRQVRLTNKTFIQVKVSKFSVKDLGDKFSVTFNQHYRANSLNDTIRKRLTFSKQGGDWAKARISSEQVVNRS